MEDDRGKLDLIDLTSMLTRDMFTVGIDLRRIVEWAQMVAQ